MLTTQYDFMNRMKELYFLLQDEKSRTLFWDRLRCDVHPSIHYVADFYTHAFDLDAEQYVAQLHLKEEAQELCRQGKQLLLYGAGGAGNMVAEILRLSDIPFTGFCDRRAESLKEVQGKPVYSPEYLFSHVEECYVIISATTFFKEISSILQENHFPQSHILQYLSDERLEAAYFEFPELFAKGTAFVDGGCYDALTSVRFAQRCGGDYSKIIAFEPDEKNVAFCQETVKQYKLHDFQLIPAGLGKNNGTAIFAVGSGASSYLKSEESFTYDHDSISDTDMSVPIVALDTAAEDTRIGFIKMDIEGSELDALQGAEKTIKRDRPLLAICVYHRQGDLLAIMDYLHEIVPEYRFWLRHYTSTPLETVLYAAIPKTSEK